MAGIACMCIAIVVRMSSTSIHTGGSVLLLLLLTTGVNYTKLESGRTVVKM